MKVNFGVYLITDPKYSVKQVEAALKSDVKMLQIRNKTKNSLAFYQEALHYQKITNLKNIPLIINDRLDIALAINADGLHIGQNDLPITVCRKFLPDKIIGVSVSTLKEAQLAKESGADYIGVGAVFPTNTKNDAKHVDRNELKKIINLVDIPIVCIGGITSENLDSLIDLGVKNVAVISDILEKSNPEQMVDKYCEKLNSRLNNEM